MLYSIQKKIKVSHSPKERGKDADRIRGETKGGRDRSGDREQEREQVEGQEQGGGEGKAKQRTLNWESQIKNLSDLGQGHFIHKTFNKFNGRIRRTQNVRLHSHCP